MQKKIQDPLLFLKISILSITLGSIYTLGRKYQNIQLSVDIYGELSYFRQPLFQVWSLFFGMSFCFIYFKIQQRSLKSKQIVLAERKCPAYLMAIPSFCDVFATILDSIGLIYTHVSVHQMLKGFIVVFTFFISIFYLKRQFKRLHYIGVILIFMGCLQIGSSNIDQYSLISAPNPLLGNLLCISGQFLLSFMFIYEELILNRYDISVMEMVGYEGLWGVLLSSVLLMLTSFYPHSFIGMNDNYMNAITQMKNNHHLLIGAVITLSTIGPFNYYGSKLIQISSAVHRCNICSLRMISVWIISIFIGWEQFRFIQLWGYIILFFGTLVYNEAFNIEPTLIRIERYLCSFIFSAKYINPNDQHKEFTNNQLIEEDDKNNTLKDNIKYKEDSNQIIKNTKEHSE